MRRPGTARQTHNWGAHPWRKHTNTHTQAGHALVPCAHWRPSRIQTQTRARPWRAGREIVSTWTWRWFVTSSIFGKTQPSQTWLMSLRGQKIKLNIHHVSHVNHRMVSCIYNAGAISEITALQCGAKYPCITPLKYRPKNPRLYFSEIKPLGLIHIQSLVTSRAVGLYNLVLAAVIGKSCFVLVSCEIGAWIRSVWLTYIWLSALSAQSKTKALPWYVRGAN